MAIAGYAEKNCSIAQPLAFLGERWTMLILRDLFLGRRRFDQFQESSREQCANVSYAPFPELEKLQR